MDLYSDAAALIELEYGGRLILSDVSRLHLGLEVVLALDRRAHETTEQSDLTDVRQRVGGGSLKQSLSRTAQRLGRRQACFDRGEPGEEPFELPVPVIRAILTPAMLPIGQCESPREEVAHVRKDFDGAA